MPGFLPTRGSLMLDVVALTMIVIVTALMISVLLVKKKKYRTHKRLQTAISILLLTAVLAFEVDMRFFTDWRELAKASRFYESGVADGVLAIHLMFAIPTPFVWGYVLVRALMGFPSPPEPGDHSTTHKKLARIAVGMMMMTAVTGWIFYLVAFVF